MKPSGGARTSVAFDWAMGVLSVLRRWHRNELIEAA
jgi:hypothetical protein